MVGHSGNDVMAYGVLYCANYHSQEYSKNTLSLFRSTSTVRRVDMAQVDEMSTTKDQVGFDKCPGERYEGGVATGRPTERATMSSENNNNVGWLSPHSENCMLTTPVYGYMVRLQHIAIIRNDVIERIQYDDQQRDRIRAHLSRTSFGRGSCSNSGSL